MSSHLSRSIVLGCAVFVSCCVMMCATNNTPGTDRVKQDHEAIKKILDAALLSDRPLEALQESLAKVRSFQSVDSAWMSGQSLFVRYKEGGTVSWSVPPNNQ